MKTCFVFLVVFLWMAASAVTVRAQESMPVTLEDVAQRAEKIISGVVVDQHSAWNDGQREIYTYTTLAVDQVIKSDKQDAVITLRHLGGRVGDIESHVPGCPQFKPGEHVIVFIGPYPNSHYYGLIDWVYGKYRITQKTTEKWVQGAGIEKRQSLNEFIEKINTFLK